MNVREAVSNMDLTCIDTVIMISDASCLTWCLSVYAVYLQIPSKDQECQGELRSLVQVQP
jgi:hypothetical protein